MCLDAENQGTANYTRVITWPCNGQSNQRGTAVHTGRIDPSGPDQPPLLVTLTAVEGMCENIEIRNNYLHESGIDAYAPSVTKQAVLFRRTDLSIGSHTIKVVCKGTKNPASSNTICALDAFSRRGFARNGYYQIVNRNSGWPWT